MIEQSTWVYIAIVSAAFGLIAGRYFFILAEEMIKRSSPFTPEIATSLCKIVCDTVLICERQGEKIIDLQHQINMIPNPPKVKIVSENFGQHKEYIYKNYKNPIEPKVFLYSQFNDVLKYVRDNKINQCDYIIAHATDNLQSFDGEHMRKHLFVSADIPLVQRKLEVRRFDFSKVQVI